MIYNKNEIFTYIMKRPIEDIVIKSIPLIKGKDGNLGFVEELSQVPFKIKRLFYINAKANSVRGNHAHKRCNQLLIVSNGSVRINCDNGQEKKSFGAPRMLPTLRSRKIMKKMFFSPTSAPTCIKCNIAELEIYPSSNFQLRTTLGG